MYIIKNGKCYKQELIEVPSDEVLKFFNKQSNYSLELEPTNFQIDSSNWKKNEEGLLVNPEGDVFEDEYGEQFFTWKAAMRETEKAGKRIPTDEEFTQIIGDMNKKQFMDKYGMDYYGYCSGGSCFSRGNYTGLWSSTESSTSAWRRYFFYSVKPVLRDTYPQPYSLSVRCIKI